MSLSFVQHLHVLLRVVPLQDDVVGNILSGMFDDHDLCIVVTMLFQVPV